MTVIYTVTPEMRLKLKKPFGTLIKGSFAQTMAILAEILQEEKPPRVVSVGDVVSKNLHEQQIIPQLAITDNRSMRKRVEAQVFPSKKVIKVKNPQGVITKEATAAIQKALASDAQIHILVDGEEDLLTLVAVLYAPENTLVVYGQPSEGIVIVKVTPEKKSETEQVLKAMETKKAA